MSIKTILCGHLPNSNSTRSHPIQNVSLLPANSWTRAELNVLKPTGERETIFTIGNIPDKAFDLTMSVFQGQIEFCVNKKRVMLSARLFYVDVNIFMLENISDYDFIKYNTTLIHDN